LQRETNEQQTGAIYSPLLITSFAKLARLHNLALIVDETYRDFVQSGIPHNLFTPSEENSSFCWRNTVIHLFSFSKSYCIPGHRLGAIVASPTLLVSLKKVLDTLQICAPRPIQLALQSTLPSLRPFIRVAASAVAHRHTLFRDFLPPRWKIGAQGGYFAYVKHPFDGIPAKEVCYRLAKDLGVVSLPGEFFRGDDEVGEDNCWIRFSVANVDDEKVKNVCERLKESESELGWAIRS
jgi:aspartate/methionine/tyrosine aminotransferase